jgi:MinD-like ATPase involved in chromosome partitioning or flagellar assembly
MVVKVPVVVAAAGASWETAALEQLARAAPSVVLLKRCVDLTDLVATCNTGQASVALVSTTLPGLDADSVGRVRRAGVSVLAVASPEELELEGERLRRIGVAQLVPTTELTRLSDVVHVVGARTQGDPDPVPTPTPTTGARSGRVTAVWGPAGAPGRTTVAVALAAELAHRGHSTFLLDVDPYGGAVGQHLGVLDEVSGLLAAARTANAGRLDPERLGTLARQADEQLRVLTGLPRPDRWAEVRPGAFAELLDQAALLAEHVVLDTGFSLEREAADPYGASTAQRNTLTLTALDHADEVIVVGTADPVGLARLARALVELREAVPAGVFRVVVNRTRPSLGWRDREIRGMVEGFVTPVDVHFLPDDRAAADRALMEGRTLVESGDSPLRRAVGLLATGVLGGPAPKQRGRRRSRFGVRRRTGGRAR